MKVGTDAVLLGAWVDLSNTQRVLDIGTGSGIIALMMAQRSSGLADIEAIEPDTESARQAKENILNSPWKGKISVHETSLQNYNTTFLFDLIVSNPPFFVNSQLPPQVRRSNARHTQNLSHQELIHHIIRLLAPHGRFAVILPTEEGLQFQTLALAHQLHVRRQLSFFSRDSKPQERWLFEFSFEQGKKLTETLVLHAEGEAWSDAYQQLTREFYLHIV